MKKRFVVLAFMLLLCISFVYADIEDINIFIGEEAEIDDSNPDLTIIGSFSYCVDSLVDNFTNYGNSIIFMQKLLVV